MFEASLMRNDPTGKKKVSLKKKNYYLWSNLVEVEGFIEEEKLLLWSNLVEVEVEWYKNGTIYIYIFCW